MTRSSSLPAALVLLALALSGCDAVGDVVEFGLWTLLIVLILIALIVYAFIRTFTD